MSQPTVLVIDDSATIRQLVDGQLSRNGYRVVLAENAELGLQFASEETPDLILLDHQLPGTTGSAVCQQLLEIPEVQQIPVIVSSTLRKRAYVEYTDFANVVDMLPKPYAAELLLTTVSNALETGSLIVQSQADGTAVPEVSEQVSKPDLSGTFTAFQPREVLDLLNHGGKCGALEIEADRFRVWFFLDRGRVQAVTASGVDMEIVTRSLPDTLQSLAPVVNLTSGGRFCHEMDGLVDLLDNRVVDPRLLRQLLRHQASMLALLCFTQKVNEFRFCAGQTAPPLFKKVALDLSLPALLVEATTHCDEQVLVPSDPDVVYVRNSKRGQNLDRGGLSAQHMKILGRLDQPATIDALCDQLAWDAIQVRRTLTGFMLCDLVESKAGSQTRNVLVLDSDRDTSAKVKEQLDHNDDGLMGKVVRDRLALQLLLRRGRPDALVLDCDSADSVRFAQELHHRLGSDGPPVKWVALLPDSDIDDCPGFFHATVKRPYEYQQLVDALGTAFSEDSSAAAATDLCTST